MMDQEPQRPVEQPAAPAQPSAALAEALELFRQLLYTYVPFNDPLWLKLDLTMAQLRGLRVLIDGPIPIGEVASELGVAQPTASLLIERLVRRGLVERIEDPGDRRRALARLTPEGAQLIARLRGERRERLLRHFSRLSEDDLAALLVGFRALAAARADEAGTQTTGQSMPEARP